MTIDIKHETLIGFSEAKELPRHPSYHKLRRWAKCGLLHRGRRVKLEWVRVGSEPCTSIEAFERFIKKMQWDEGDNPR